MKPCPHILRQVVYRITGVILLNVARANAIGSCIPWRRVLVVLLELQDPSSDMAAADWCRCLVSRRTDVTYRFRSVCLRFRCRRRCRWNVL